MHIVRDTPAYSYTDILNLKCLYLLKFSKTIIFGDEHKQNKKTTLIKGVKLEFFRLKKKTIKIPELVHNKPSE